MPRASTHFGQLGNLQADSPRSDRLLRVSSSVLSRARDVERLVRRASGRSLTGLRRRAKILTRRARTLHEQIASAQATQSAEGRLRAITEEIESVVQDLRSTAELPGTRIINAPTQETGLAQSNSEQSGGEGTATLVVSGLALAGAIYLLMQGGGSPTGERPGETLPAGGVLIAQ